MKYCIATFLTDFGKEKIYHPISKDYSIDTLPEEISSLFQIQRKNLQSLFVLGEGHRVEQAQYHAHVTTEAA